MIVVDYEHQFPPPPPPHTHFNQIQAHTINMYVHPEPQQLVFSVFSDPFTNSPSQRRGVAGLRENQIGYGRLFMSTLHTEAVVQHNVHHHFFCCCFFVVVAQT